jgi:CheY-like chemotaxis protein
MPASHAKALPKVSLLCIDDDPSVLECEKAFLGSFGYTVATASSGREGLELAALRSYDLVIVDYIMPEMNGHEFATAMRRLWAQVPIIMLSGTVNIPAQALEVIDAFVAKDRLATQLLPAIELLIEGTLGSQPAADKRVNWDMMWHRRKPVHSSDVGVREDP